MNFQERFKGKTTLMTKNGPTELLSQVQTSIPKYLETTKLSDLNKPASKPLKLPLQTYNPKYPPVSNEFPKEKQVFMNSNPFLVQNPYVLNEDAENQQGGSGRNDLNNFQAHYLRGSPSMKNPMTNSKDILVSNSKNIMMDSPQDSRDKPHDKRPPSFDSINNKISQINRKANTANGSLDNNDLKYKPYTLKDYTEIQKTASSTLQKGLGPNINTEDWLVRKEKIEKMNNFSQYVKLFNTKKISDGPRMGDLDREYEERAIGKSKREKALEFAKNIPKPVFVSVKRKKENEGNKQESQEFRDELQLLEQQHLKLLNEIENMNNGKQVKKK